MWNLFGFKRGADPEPADLPTDPVASADLAPTLPPAVSSEIRDLVVSSPLIFYRYYLDIEEASLLSERKGELEVLKQNLPDSAQLLQGKFDKFFLAIDSASKIVATTLPDSRTSSALYYSTNGFVRALDTVAKSSQKFDSIKERIDSLRQDDLGDSAASEFVSGLIESGHEFIAKCESRVEIISKVSLRDYPRGNDADTLWKIETDGRAKYRNDGSGLLFISNEEILSINLRGQGAFQHRYTHPQGDIQYGILDDGRHVIQQTGMRSCTATVMNMVLMDFGFEPDSAAEYTRNLGSCERIVAELGDHGIKVSMASLPFRCSDDSPTPSVATSPWRYASDQERASILMDHLSQSHCLILSVDGEIGGHVIILDSLSIERDRAVIRDPYHGWSIEVKASAVLNRADSEIIVIEKRSAPRIESVKEC